MTDREAIDILSNHTNLGYGIIIEGDTKKIKEALDLAIKALKEIEGLKEENHQNFVNSQYIISSLVEENKKLRGAEE